MTILCNELTLEQVNAALLRIQRSIQSNTNNFQNDVEKAVANVTVQAKNTTIHYDDSKLWNVINTIQNDIKNIKITDFAQDSKIANLEALMASINFNYDPDTKVLTLQVGSKITEIQLIDTTYTFAYDSTTSKLTVTDNITQSAVFDETIVGTTYTFSFTNGVLTAHNNLLNTDQTFNFDSRYYTESEIQSLILDKIPTQASAQNQLADKDFVNSSIATSTATFRGTVTSTTALAALTGDLNDYAFVQNIDPTTGQTLSYDRYKWVESGGDYGHWKYEYTLNNSSFTSDQWTAINSGITCQIVTDLLDGCYSGESNTDVYCNTTCKCTINSETPLCLCANAFNANATISTDTYPGACCTGTVTISDKAAANEWTPLLLCTGVTSVGKSSSCSLNFNTCTGVLLASRYCVNGHGNAKFAAQDLSASDLGLTAGCCYPLTCILESIMACKGYAAGTYTFVYADAKNPIICETGEYAYRAVFTKEDAYNPVAYTWNMTRWRVTLNDGSSYCASAYSTANAGIACWKVNGSAAVRISRNPTTCDGSCHLALFGDNTSNQRACIYVSNGCSATFNPATGVLSADCFNGTAKDSTCFGGCTYADACTDIRRGLISGGSFNGTDGTVSNGCLSFSDINFDNICNSTSKGVAANNITRRHIITNRISSVGYITRWGLGLERGTTCWGTGLLSLGVKDDGTCFADYKFTHAGSISLTCCGTAKCITLEGCATKNVFTCCLTSTNNTQRYFQIKTKAYRGTHSVSFDFDFFSMNGTINLDNNGANQYYSGSYYGYLCVSVCGYTCACCDCFWLTYKGYRTLTLKSVYDFEVLCDTTTAPTGVTFCCFVKRPGTVTKVDVSDDVPYNVLLSKAANDTAMPSIGSNDNLTYIPNTGILNVNCGTCIGWYRTKSRCVKVTPAAQSSCWIYIGRFQTNGTGDTINTYNELNLTIAAVGLGMVSSANISVLSASAVSPTVIVQRQAGYSSSTGIDCVAVTRSGSVWTCYVCVWARVKSYGTNAYYVHLYRNMLPDTWGTALTVCSAITGDIVGVGNVGINTRAIQSNADLRIGSLTACTSSIAGCSGGSYGSGWMELFGTTPFIDFHVNNSGADCSSRIIANTGSLGFNVNNATGCTASTESAGYTMCSNGLLYSGKGFVAGCVNAACPFVYIDCTCGQRMISMTRAASADIGLMLSHAADWTGTTYCNLGIEIGAGNVNRGFYHWKAGSFEWLQYWDATCERHACPQCFACPIYGCSSATFAGQLTADSYKTQALCISYSFPANSTSYILLGCYKPSNLANVSNELNLGFTAGGVALVEKGSIKLLLTTADGSCFCNNNIEVKMSNYLIGPNRPGVCAIGFTSSGSSWNCQIGVWLAVRNNETVARTWVVDLLRNKVDNCWKSCMICTTTMPTFVCTVQVPSTQNFHFNNAYSMINQWSYETGASQTACMRYATLIIGQVNCVRKPTHQKLLVTTTITGSENPLNMWIEYMGGYGDKDFLQACYSGGNCNVIIPMRIGSDSENIYIDFAVCCSVSRTICSDIYSSGNMQLGSKGNALRSYPYTLCYVPQEDVHTCVMSQWPTTIIFNVDDPASQFATRVIAANTISAYCMATTSDVRQKKDIVPYNKGLCDVKNLDIISFRYKSEDDKAIKHVSVPANWTCQLISGKNQDQFRVNDTVGILLSAVKDLSKSMTLAQKIKLWLYKKFIEPRNNKKLNDKLESFN